MTWLAATERFLTQIGRPARISPLASYLVREERVESHASDFAATLRASVRRDIRRRAANDGDQRFYMVSGVVGLTKYDPDRLSIDIRETYAAFEREWEQPLTRPDVQLWEHELGVPHRLELQTSRRVVYSRAECSGGRDYVEVPVWYATDRNRTTNSEDERWYGKGRGSLEYGCITVSIPDRHGNGRSPRAI